MMKMKKDRRALYENLPSLDPSKEAAEGLDVAIQDEAGDDDQITIVDEKLKEQREMNIQGGPEEDGDNSGALVDVSEAMRGAPVLSHTSDRQRLRLLILTRDTSITSAGSLAQKRMIELSDMFAELHIVVLNMKEDSMKNTARIAGNAWVYPTNSTYWWKMVFDANRVIHEQLSFAQGFRADSIVAEDPFESGIAGYRAAFKFERPFQVHVFEDIYDPAFVVKKEYNNLRLFMARYVLGRADCIRTKSAYIKERIVENYPDLNNRIEVLPIYYNLNAWKDAVPTFNLKEKYPQFKLIMLHVTNMNELSHTDRVINGSARMLKQYPAVGLVILGDGPLRAKLEKHVITLGLSTQVAFEPDANDTISYMKSSNLLLYLSEDVEEEYIVLQAAAVGLPMVTGVAGLAGELFLDGENAFVCPNDSPPCIGEKINRFLNENQLRTKFSREAQNVVFDRIEQDYGSYMESYTESIERCVVGES